MSTAAIEDHGLIGDMHSAALVGLDGSIDWFCVPYFDSPSVFARLLDDERGGHFSIAPTGPGATSRQLYWPETNVLLTRFFGEDGAAELSDFMPVCRDGSGGKAGAPHEPSAPRPDREIVRQVRSVRGEVDLEMTGSPAFDYARQDHEVELFEGGARFVATDGTTLVLWADVPLRRDGGSVRATVRLHHDECATFVLRHESEAPTRRPTGPLAAAADRAFRETVAFWRQWISRCRYTGRWRETVHRSALALKLMTFAPTGAIIAAPTCSLPESVGGRLNWDYRYLWIRDSAFTVYALLRLGFAEEASAYMHFVMEHCVTHGDRPLQVMYGIDGRTELPEEELDHLDGYRGSRPVRIGNAAHRQFQLDIYGALLDAAYLFNKWGEPLSSDLWTSLRSLVDWVCENWQHADAGVWEFRGERRHFVYSKVMCWVAVDRGLRIAAKRSLPADRVAWERVRDAIYDDIFAHGWSEERQAFVQSYGSDALDAANLIMPLVLFLGPTDPKALATADAICRSPTGGGRLSNSLVFRYLTEGFDDGCGPREGTFNICTFWLVEVMTRAGRFEPERLDRARLMFERMLGFANHVGLYAEETGLQAEALGNFPQAFTHLALISAAFNLDKTLGAGA